MQPQTNKADTKTWLEASKEIDIRAYIEGYMPNLNICANIFPLASIYKTQVEVCVPSIIKQSVTLDPIMQTEFQAWEVLSDEALRDFELRLL